VLDELAHLAPALAEQGDHVDVGPRLARDHAQQRALAHAGPAKMPTRCPRPKVSVPSMAARRSRAAVAHHLAASGLGGSAESGTRVSLELARARRSGGRGR
jgi:hypothetical protein